MMSLNSFFNKNEDALIFILIGACSITLFVLYFFNLVTVDFSDVPAGMSGKRGYLLKYVLYSIGGEPFMIVFFFVLGTLLIIVGVSNLRK